MNKKSALKPILHRLGIVIFFIALEMFGVSTLSSCYNSPNLLQEFNTVLFFGRIGKAIFGTIVLTTIIIALTRKISWITTIIIIGGVLFVLGSLSIMQACA
jgi:hypothetical protein